MFALSYPTLAIAGSTERFPVRRIYCVGQNYAAHAREMGNDPEREAPVWFMKVSDCIVAGGGEVA
jgi:fumarylpyruvate hydrolase